MENRILQKLKNPTLRTLGNKTILKYEF